MKLLAPVLVFLGGVCSLFAQSRFPDLMPSMGQHHHRISTKNPQAQRLFDQGLTLVFAFNHEEAARAFRRAAELDPQSAMAFWGVALALGPCINLDVDPPHEKAAYEAIQNALSLGPGATESERAYIQALAKRYSSDAKIDLRKLDADYAQTMRELHKRYPDDLDAATLYAESLMDLRPWKLWSLDGRPKTQTRSLRFWNPCCGVIQSISERTTITSTLWRLRDILSELFPALHGWRRLCPPRGISFICPRTSSCASATTPPQRAAQSTGQ